MNLKLSQHLLNNAVSAVVTNRLQILKTLKKILNLRLNKDKIFFQLKFAAVYTCDRNDHKINIVSMSLRVTIA